MKIAELSNGKYAIQVSRFPRRFLDLKSPGYHWDAQNKYFEDCQGTLDEIIFQMQQMKVVKNKITILRYINHDTAK